MQCGAFDWFIKFLILGTYVGYLASSMFVGQSLFRYVWQISYRIYSADLYKDEKLRRHLYNILIFRSHCPSMSFEKAALIQFLGKPSHGSPISVKLRAQSATLLTMVSYPLQTMRGGHFGSQKNFKRPWRFFGFNWRGESIWGDLAK